MRGFDFVLELGVDFVDADVGGGAGGDLTLQAGRSILINNNITTDDGNLILTALPEKLRESAYALACDVAAADADVNQAELELLRWLRGRLGLARLEAAAIELATRAHYIVP